MQQTDRRTFVRTLSLTGMVFLGFRLSGCRTSSGVSAAADSDNPDSSVPMTTIYDLQMEGWSLYDQTQLGLTGVLKAEQVQANVPITLPYTQDSHGHAFELKEEHFLRLRRGEPIRVRTTDAMGHAHEVRIDPIQNRVPGSAGITMPIDPAAVVVPPPPNERLYATLDAGGQPKLYVSGSEELQVDSAEFCVAAREQCDSDPSLWHRMKAHLTNRNRQAFVSEEGLTLDEAVAETPLSVRARLKATDRLVSAFFKILRQ